MAKVYVSKEAVQRLIDNLDDVVYEEGVDNGPVYFPRYVYSDKEARRIARDFLHVVANFAVDILFINNPYSLLDSGTRKYDLINMLVVSSQRLADLLDKEE